VTYSMKDLRRLRRAMLGYARRLHGEAIVQYQDLVAQGPATYRRPKPPVRMSQQEREVYLQTYLVAGIPPAEIVKDLQRQTSMLKPGKRVLGGLGMERRLKLA